MYRVGAFELAEEHSCIRGCEAEIFVQKSFEIVFPLRIWS